MAKFENMFLWGRAKFKKDPQVEKNKQEIAQLKVKTTELASGLSNKPNRNEVVDLTSRQIISGEKNFTALPKSGVVPTTNQHLVNKEYVDSKVAVSQTQNFRPGSSTNIVQLIDPKSARDISSICLFDTTGGNYTLVNNPTITIGQGQNMLLISNLTPRNDYYIKITF